LASWLNAQDLHNDAELISLKEELGNYFSLLKKLKLEEKYLADFVEKGFKPISDFLYFIVLAPIVAIGLIHNYPMYRFVKRFVEKSFKRPVFWGSVKMVFGTLLFGLYNILIVVLANYLLYNNALFWTLYFFIVPPITGVIAYNYFRRLKRYKVLKKMNEGDLTRVFGLRSACLDAIQRKIPVA
jgi:hypothetical protein